MKKITGIIGISIIALAMFMNTTNIKANGTSDITLKSLIRLSSANAEDCHSAFFICDELYPYDYFLFSACMIGNGCEFY